MPIPCDKCHKEVDTTMSIREGVICAQCQSRLQAAKSEPTRTCLHDGQAMQKDLVLNIIIDKCPSCGGVWLDGGEINLIKDTLRNFQNTKNWANTGANILAGIIGGVVVP